MVFGDAESISGVKKKFNHNKHPKARMATNPDKNIKKNMQNSLSTDLQSLMLL